MRIAVLAWTDRRAGGVETYLEAVLPHLAGAGHELGLWHEVSAPEGRAPLTLPETIARHHCDAHTIAALRSWAPDVVVSNGLVDAALEARLTAVAPSVLIAHNYHGTCISGTKCWSVPARRPCTRVFGAACLALYFPRRCGGLSPITMARLYGRSRARLRTVRTCRRVVVLSAHMRDEYVRHGLDPAVVAVVPYGPPAHGWMAASRGDASARLIAVGRLEPLKGVDLLIDSLPRVRRALDRPIVLTIAGDGSQRAVLEAQAARLNATDTGIHVRFAGWLDEGARDAELAAADLLVLPSVWPEPFGIAGLDAAHLGVPSVAFAVGGVAEWLADGETGQLATADPPSAAGLADAIVRALRDPPRHAQMRQAAAAMAATRSPARHAARLADVLASVADGRLAPPG